MAPPTPEDLRAIYGLCAVVDGEVPSPPPNWTQVWAPPTGGKKGNYAKVFQMSTEVIVPIVRPVRVPLPIYALVIQGTQDWKDILEDFAIIPQVPFPAIAGAQISKGSADAMNAVLALADATSGQTLLNYLKALPAGVSLVVTGHSLGGNVASVLVPWIAANIPAFGPNTNPLFRLPENLVGITFAAPTAGDPAFAGFLNKYFYGYYAYFNSNDVVPNVWDTRGTLQINNIDSLFPSPGPNPAPDGVKLMLKNKIDAMKKAGVIYVQTNGTTFAFPSATPPGKDPWLWELSYQHNYAYCKTYLGDEGGCKP